MTSECYLGCSNKQEEQVLYKEIQRLHSLKCAHTWTHRNVLKCCIVLAIIFNILSLCVLAHMFLHVITFIIIVLSISECIYVIIIFLQSHKTIVLLYYISFPMPFYSLMVIFKSKSLIIFWDLEVAKCNRNRCIWSNLY